MSSGDSTSRAWCGEQVDPAHVPGARPLAEAAGSSREAARTLVQADEVGRDLATVSSAAAAASQRLGARAVERGAKPARARARPSAA